MSGILCKTKTIDVPGLGAVTARELTMGEVRKLQAGADALMERTPYTVEGLLVDEQFIMETACLSTGLTPEQLDGDDMTASAASAIWAAVVEVNDFLQRRLKAATTAT